MNAPPNREKEIFEKAIEIQSQAERETFIKGACGDDAALLQRVTDLLTAHKARTDFLPGKSNDDKTIPDEPVITEDVGSMIGRYKLLEKIGEGGFGVVWAAEQREPVKRRVALKIIKLGMDTKQVVARFEAERQALAMMDHPNIARVLDAGATETGRPYFVMELVRGIPITKYCDQEKLDTKTRLDLFIKICQAIQHAHQKGIIHRDIKPSNILVTLHDGVPVPKVIDFGIAKATQAELTEKTIYTQYSQFIGTPAYMSPEQAEMSGLDIDTRSDIYSLGVLLYELLTGSTPFDTKELMQSGLDEMRKIIREREPMRPSTRLSQTLVAADASPLKLNDAGTERVKADSRRLLHEIRGDLDWIVMKCLEKDRSRRYDTANGLAMDIKRHLNNEPVVARPPSAAYKFQKAWRRNKVVYTAGAAVAVALVIGIGVSVWQTRVARLAQRETEVARFNEAVERQKADQKAEEAETERDRANANAKAAREQQYAADIAVAQIAIEQNNFGRARDLLSRHIPKDGQEDLRDFVWRYLMSEAQGKHTRGYLAHEHGIWRLDISKDGEKFLSRDGRGNVAVWDRAAGRIIYRYQFKRDDGVDAVFLNDSRSLAVWSTVSGYLRIFDCRSGELEFERTGVAGFISPDRRWIPVRETPESPLRLFDLELRRAGPVFEIPGPFGGVIEADKYALSYSSSDNNISAAKIEFLKFSGEKMDIAPPNDNYLTAIAYNSETGRLATGDYGLVSIYDLENQIAPRSRDLVRGAIAQVGFSEDGRYLAVAAFFPELKIWDLETDEVAEIAPLESEVWSFAFEPGNRSMMVGYKDGSIRIWPIDFNTEESSPEFIVPGRSLVDTAGISGSGYALSDNGRLIAIASTNESTGDPEIGFYRTDNYELEFLLPTSESPLEFLDHDSVLLTMSASSMTHWNLGSGESRPVPLKKPLDNPASPVVSWDRTRVVVPDGSHSVKIFDLQTGALIEEIDGLNMIPKAVAISPDNQLLAVGRGNLDLEIFDLSHSDVPLMTFEQSRPRTMIFTPDSKALIAGGREGLNYWDLETRTQIPLRGQLRENVGSIALSPDGNTLANNNILNGFTLWNLRTFREMVNMKLEGAYGTSLKFSRSGNVLVTRSNGRTRVWHAPTIEELEAEMERKAKNFIEQKP